jgi:hypothetical protein
MIGYWGSMMRNYQRYKFANSQAKKKFVLICLGLPVANFSKRQEPSLERLGKVEKNYGAIIFSNCSARAIQSFFLANT